MLHAQVRELIYREILEYHPNMLADFLAGGRQQPSFMYPSAVDNFKRQFAQLESGGRTGVGMGNLGQVCSFASTLADLGEPVLQVQVAFLLLDET